MTHKQFCLRTLVLLGLAVGLMYLAGMLASPNLRLSDEEYLANLRENSEFGPATFLQKRARVLVIGDSHSYSGFDYAELARGLGTTSISSCAMGGFYADSLPMVVRLLRAQEYHPAVIIYGFSQRQLFDGKNKKAQLAQHERALAPKLFPGLREAARNLWTVILLQLDRKRAMLSWPGRDDATFAANSGPIAALRPLGAGRMAAAAKLPGLATWDEVIASAKISEGQRGNLAELCALVRETGAELYVFCLPESPELESRYPEALRQEVLETLSVLSGCAMRVEMERPEAYGLGDEHFVNRAMAFGYDYAKWRAPGFKPTGHDFDPDHMNLVGARVFTRSVAASIRASSKVLPMLQRPQP